MCNVSDDQDDLRGTAGDDSSRGNKVSTRKFFIFFFHLFYFFRRVHFLPVLCSLEEGIFSIYRGFVEEGVFVSFLFLFLSTAKVPAETGEGKGRLSKAPLFVPGVCVAVRRTRAG